MKTIEFPSREQQQQRAILEFCESDWSHQSTTQLLEYVFRIVSDALPGVRCEVLRHEDPAFFEVPPADTQRALEQADVPAADQLTVNIGPDDSPWGILKLTSSTAADFREEDHTFLKTMAGLLHKAFQQNRQQNDLVTLKTEVINLRQNEERFRTLAESINQVFWIREAEHPDLQYISPAWARMVGCRFNELDLARKNWRDYLHPDDRERVEQEFQLKAACSQYDVLFRIVRTDGQIRWLHEVAVPRRDETGAISHYYGVIDDITERRELEMLIAEVANHEQQRISQDLHDGIGQELTGLTMMCQQLVQRMKNEKASAVEHTEQIFDGLKRTLQQVRQISRGLSPVNIEAGGLPAALVHLAEQMQNASSIECSFVCPSSISLQDPHIANHLFYVAREAVTNAVKHAKATRVVISLSENRLFYQLTIEDDGMGISKCESRDSDGMGLKTMQYRANLIGGEFSLETPASGGTCVLFRIRK